MRTRTPVSSGIARRPTRLAAKKSGFAKLLVGLLVAASVPVGASSRADDRTRWVLAIARAGSQGASLAQITIETRDTPHGTEPIVDGSGMGTSMRGGWVSAFDRPSTGGPVRVRTTSTLGNIDIVVGDQPGVIYSGGGSAFVYDHLQAHETMAGLVFVTGAAIDHGFRVTTSVGSGEFELIEVRSGSDTGVLPVAGPTTAGVAAEAGPIGGGTSQHGLDVGAGLVGTFLHKACLSACVGTWRAPDGQEGVGVSLGVIAGVGAGVGIGSIPFAGPSGHWDWSWTGLTEGFACYPLPYGHELVFGAWASIGDHWTFFSIHSQPFLVMTTCRPA